MLIKKLTLTNFRAYTQAEFEFQQGLNLLVGINGVGKTSVLDALKICFSVIYPEISETKQRKESFRESDIKIGASSLQVSCDFSHLGNDYNLLIVKRRENIVENKTTNIRDQVIDVPDQEVITPKIDIGEKDYPNSGNDPIGILFSTNRSIAIDRSVSKGVAQVGQAAAHAEALSENRFFNLRVFTDWYRAQKSLSTEDVQISENLTAIQTVVESFLPGFRNLRAEEKDSKFELWIDKNNMALSVYQLSDGERGMLSIAIDIARRLVQANPVSENPIKMGDGVVLIDELDLHLHPKWQRSVVANLTRSFPLCQFIATTHSPQIIGEVKPEFITIIDNGTYRPASSYGVDSGRILEEILDTPARTKAVNQILAQLYKFLDEENLDEAKVQVKNLIAIVGVNDPEVTRSETMINFLEDDLDNETDKKG